MVRDGACCASSMVGAAGGGMPREAAGEAAYPSVRGDELAGTVVVVLTN
jgi:hypothetical protein